MKAPIPEQVEMVIEHGKPGPKELAIVLKAACERLAEQCSDCYGLCEVSDCDYREGEGVPHKTWQDVCRSLSDKR